LRIVQGSGSACMSSTAAKNIKKVRELNVISRFGS
jgi:hypothetical protein